MGSGSHGRALEMHNAAYATQALLLLVCHLFWLPGVVACVIVAVFNGTGGGCCYNAALALALHVRWHGVADRVYLCMAFPLSPPPAMCVWQVLAGQCDYGGALRAV